ncbi:hypothetical protein LOD99_11384 [Oopsacas minuta]|uniref:DUF4371 domain-containing protein n=1 Tax=Oopsacas minuta TaxID=111878 RepID=A0AAV7K318_9METZ|nr:hypothetical protein LOD99_11384 [Oopsacas minuta]
MLPNVLPSAECKDGRSRFLKKEWFKKYSWLKLNDDLSLSVCYWAIQNKRIHPSERGNTLENSKWTKTNTEEGWASFKYGKSHLDGHEGVDHTNAWRVYQMELNKQNCDPMFETKRSEEIRRNRVGLRVTFDNFMTCATQGHGDEKQTGNLWNLVSLVSRFNKDAKKYFTNDSDSKIKFLSSGIQNEMIMLLADNLLKFFSSKIREESTAGQAKAEGRFFYSCIMDETEDIRTREQVSVVYGM